MIGASLAIAVGAVAVVKNWIDAGQVTLGAVWDWFDGGDPATEDFDREIDGDL